MITYHLKLSGQDPRVLYSDMEFVAGDVGAYRLVFSFFDENTPLSLSGKVLSVKIKRADGTVLSDSGNITNDTAVYIPKNDCFCVPGSVTFEIALMDSAKNYITTKIIHASVLESVGEPSDTAGDSSSVFVTLLTQTKAQLDAANQACDTAKELLTQTQNSLTEKADKATSISGYGITDAYTKTEVDEAIASVKTAKADKATTLSGYGIKDAYIKKEVDDLLGDKVDKVEGKSLSANDFTDIDKAKLNNLPTKVENDAVYASKTELNDIKMQLEKEANNLYANALKGSASGDIIRVDDMSPVEHRVGVTVKSENLFRVTSTKTLEKNGVTFTQTLGDSFITVNGTPEVNTSMDSMCVVTLPAGTYTFSMSGGQRNDNGAEYVHFKDVADALNSFSISGNVPKTFTCSKDVTFAVSFISLAGIEHDNVMIKIQIEKGAVATDWKPYVDVQSVKVTALGKNLYKPNDVSETTFGNSTYRIENGVLYINGTTGAYGYRTAHQMFLPKGTYALTVILSHAITGAKLYCSIRRAGTSGGVGLVLNPDTNETTKTATVTLNEDMVAEVYMWFDAGIAANNLEVRAQLEVGETATEFEPYKEPIEYTVNADGTVNEVKSIYPNMTLMADKSGVVMDAEYNKDANKVIEKLTNAIISLGGNV